MSRYPHSQNSLSQSKHKWLKIIDHRWEETWQVVANRDSRLSGSHFEVDF